MSADPFFEHRSISLSRGINVEKRIRGQKKVVVCVPDGVASAKTDPLRDRPVLLLGLGQLSLCAVRLEAL